MSSMIETVNLKKTFGDHEVLRGISQHIEKGEKVVIIGPSGSGKSTFLRGMSFSRERRSMRQRSISTRSGSGWGWSFSSSTCFR